jgi:hypothetical protein
MPNTLAHVGLQSLITRGAIRGADLKWVYLGLFIPDLPWIWFRIFKSLPLKSLGLDPYFYDAMAFVHVQASLLFCILLAGVLALFSSLPRRAFVLLALNATLHLLLDSLQTKWANGVHFFAPFSWDLTNFGLFWPESAVTLGLTLLGAVYIFAAWRSSGDPVIDLAWPKGRRLGMAGVLLAIYFVTPLALLSGPKAADNHSIATLLDVPNRAGRAVAFDRPSIRDQEGGVVLFAPNGEALDLVGPELPKEGRASLRGRFSDPGTIAVEAYHQHWGSARDFPTLLGLFLIAVIWLKAVWHERRKRLSG